MTIILIINAVSKRGPSQPPTRHERPARALSQPVAGPPSASPSAAPRPDPRHVGGARRLLADLAAERLPHYPRGQGLSRAPGADMGCLDEEVLDAVGDP